MFWIVALVAVVIAASIARHAMQDHRDAEVMRRNALADLEGPRDWQPARSDVELPREVQRDPTPGGVSVPPGAHRPGVPQSDERARSRP